MFSLEKNAAWLLTVLCLCACATDNPEPIQVAQAEPKTFSLSAYLQTARLYTWVELIGDEPSNNRGAMWVHLHDGKIYSLSWPEPDPNTDQPEWPAVAGRGVLRNNTMKVAWRNATGDPAHAFYHATSVGVFSNNADSIAGSFLQQEMPGDDELGEGDYQATLATDTSLSKNADTMYTQLAYIIQQSQVSEQRCPVLPLHNGLPAINQEYQGQVYQFCCPSCKTLFADNPQAFVK